MPNIPAVANPRFPTVPGGIPLHSGHPINQSPVFNASIQTPRGRGYHTDLQREGALPSLLPLPILEARMPELISFFLKIHVCVQLAWLSG